MTFKTSFIDSKRGCTNKLKIFVELNSESKTRDVQQLVKSTTKPRYYDTPRNSYKKSVERQLDRLDYHRATHWQPLSRTVNV